MIHLHIDIVSDIACPWCAIGYARLEKALEQLAGELETSIAWRAFELDPDAGSEPILPALARKYGRPEAEMEAAQEQMKTVARELGLNFSRMQQRRTCNTFDAHRLVKWAATLGQATAMKQALFDAYFGEAEDVSERGVLLRAVDTAGLDSRTAAEVLDGEDFAGQVREEETRYQKAGVTAVPSFIVNQRYIISGAQEPETLAGALREIAAEAA